MGWKEIKQRARRVVHAQFAMPAVYRSASGLTVKNVSARLHMERQVFGDLDREGFARTIENTNIIVIDRLEVRVTRGDTLFFGDDIGTVEVVNVLKRDGEFQPVEVILK